MLREKLKPVTVETCRHRLDVATDRDARETATCSLVNAAIGAKDNAWHRVRRDACEACCGGFPPSTTRANPVVAALIHEASSAILREGGVNGCDQAQAYAARALVLDQLDLELPEEPQDSRVQLEPSAMTLLPDLPARRSRQRVRSWAVGVTTAPRRQETLARTLESLAAAGWTDTTLFIDSAVKIPEKFAHLPGTFRDARLGAWPNYYLALAEMLLRAPEADALLIAQDDIVFPPGVGVRQYLEAALWPGEKPGLVSLYCSSVYTKEAPGWYPHRGVWVWGALAIVFTRELARDFILDGRVFDHRRDRLNDGLANIDLVIGAWAVRRGIAVWHPSPSLVQHIGESSTIWPSDRADGPRRADRFAGDVL